MVTETNIGMHACSGVAKVGDGMIQAIPAKNCQKKSSFIYIVLLCTKLKI